MTGTRVARKHIDRSRARAWALQIQYRWETSDKESDLRQTLVEVQRTRRVARQRLEYIRRLLEGLAARSPGEDVSDVVNRVFGRGLAEIDARWRNELTNP